MKYDGIIHQRILGMGMGCQLLFIYYYASLSHLIQWTNRTQRRRRKRMKSRFKSTPKSLPKNLHLQQLPPEPLYGRVWTRCVSKWEGRQVFVHVLIENKWCKEGGRIDSSRVSFELGSACQRNVMGLGCRWIDKGNPLPPLSIEINKIIIKKNLKKFKTKNLGWVGGDLRIGVCITLLKWLVIKNNNCRLHLLC
jgi:hypothetical protein